MGQDKLLVITDQVAVSISAVSAAIKKVRKEEVVELDPLIITQATSDSKSCRFYFSPLKYIALKKFLSLESFISDIFSW